MDIDYSKDWVNLILQMNNLEKAVFYYNKVDDNIKQKDLKMALKQNNMLKELSILKMMAHGYFFGNSIELVLEELVYIAVYGHEECVGYAMEALQHVNIKKCRHDIVKYVYKNTEKHKEDQFVFHYSWRLLYNLSLKKELIEYINKYSINLIDELSGEDREDIERMTDFR